MLLQRLQLTEATVCLGTSTAFLVQGNTNVPVCEEETIPDDRWQSVCERSAFLDVDADRLVQPLLFCVCG